MLMLIFYLYANNRATVFVIQTLKLPGDVAEPSVCVLQVDGVVTTYIYRLGI